MEERGGSLHFTDNAFIPSVLAQAAAVLVLLENKVSPMNPLQSSEEKTLEKVSEGVKESPSNEPRNSFALTYGTGDTEIICDPVEYHAEASPCKVVGAKWAAAANREAEAARRLSWVEEMDEAFPVCGNLEYFGSPCSDYVEKLPEEDFNGGGEFSAPLPASSKVMDSPAKIVPVSTQSQISDSPAKTPLVPTCSEIPVPSFIRAVLDCLPRDGVYRRQAATHQHQDSRYQEQHLTHYQDESAWMKSLQIRSRRRVDFGGNKRTVFRTRVRAKTPAMLRLTPETRLQLPGRSREEAQRGRGNEHRGHSSKDSKV